MATLTLRGVKGSPLTNQELDANFTALNNELATKLASADAEPADFLASMLSVDGSGSGLDADLLDGMNSATAATANTIVARDGSGNFAAGTITANLTGNVTGNVSGTAGGLSSTLAVNQGGTGATTAAAARTALGLAIGTDVQAFDGDLTAIAALSSAGIITRTATNTAAVRTITGTTGYITVTNGDGVSGNPVINIGTNVAKADSENTFTQPQQLDDLHITGRYTQAVISVSANTVDCSQGNYFTKTVTDNITFAFSNVPTGRAYTCALEITHTDGLITWPSAVKWRNGGFAPILTTGRSHLFFFTTDNGGTTWRGAYQINYID